MKRYLIVVLVCVAAAAALSGQRGRWTLEPGPYEVKAIFPREISPARYQQVEPRELAQAAEDGWELVSVTPYVYLNEERGSDVRKPVVTQTYVAYFFKRVKTQPTR